MNDIQNSDFHIASQLHLRTKKIIITLNLILLMSGPQENTSDSTVSKKYFRGFICLQNPTDTSYTDFENQNYLQITIYKMSGQNYLEWSQFVEMYLRGVGVIRLFERICNCSK